MHSIRSIALMGSVAISLLATASYGQAVPAAVPGYLLELHEGGYPSGLAPFGSGTAWSDMGYGVNQYTNVPFPPAPFGTALLFDADASAQVSTSLTGSPSITAVASADYAHNALADGQLNYDFEIVGPGAQGSGVAIDVSSTLTTQTAGDGGEAIASLDLIFNNPANGQWTAFGGLAGTSAESIPGFEGQPGFAPPDSTVNYSGVLDLESGVIYEMQMGLQTGVTGDDPGATSTASATIDPTLTIDPTFLGENPGYSIVFSDGVTQGSSVPDGGATVAMLGSALAGLAMLRRRFAK